MNTFRLSIVHIYILFIARVHNITKKHYVSAKDHILPVFIYHQDTYYH